MQAAKSATGRRWHVQQGARARSAAAGPRERRGVADQERTTQEYNKSSYSEAGARPGAARAPGHGPLRRQPVETTACPQGVPAAVRRSRRARRGAPSQRESEDAADVQHTGGRVARPKRRPHPPAADGCVLVKQRAQKQGAHTGAGAGPKACPPAQHGRPVMRRAGASAGAAPSGRSGRALRPRSADLLRIRRKSCRARRAARERQISRCP
ncbi:MAG: hypothetical protein J3K34DRAFT_108003 [Monoraphidium minutum]|nr:MAG: hypothetical protein J3K34DRAFT_108003 [Monoraphidium minutum]